jgi:hypothetical protein
MKNTLALSTAAVALLVTSLPAQAAFVMDLMQVADSSQPLGFDVVASGSGPIDLTGLSSIGIEGAADPNMTPVGAIISTGSVAPQALYRTVTGPTSFGSGGSTVFANSASGDSVAILNPPTVFGELGVPVGYKSGSRLSSSATWDNATFESLGVTPGAHVWTWGTGAHADSFTLNAVVPEPSTWALMALGFAGLGLAGWRTRRRSVSIAA